MAKKEMTREAAAELIEGRVLEFERDDLVELVIASFTLFKRGEVKKAEQQLAEQRRAAANLRHGIIERWPQYLARGGEVDDEVNRLMREAALSELLTALPTQPTSARLATGVAAITSPAPATGLLDKTEVGEALTPTTATTEPACVDGTVTIETGSIVAAPEDATFPPKPAAANALRVSATTTLTNEDVHVGDAETIELGKAEHPMLVIDGDAEASPSDTDDVYEPPAIINCATDENSSGEVSDADAADLVLTVAHDKVDQPRPATAISQVDVISDPPIATSAQNSTPMPSDPGQSAANHAVSPSLAAMLAQAGALLEEK